MLCLLRLIGLSAWKVPGWCLWHISVGAEKWPRICHEDALTFLFWRAACMRMHNPPNTQCAIRCIKDLMCCPWSNVCCEYHHGGLWVCGMCMYLSTCVFIYPALTRLSMRQIIARPWGCAGPRVTGQEPTSAQVWKQACTPTFTTSSQRWPVSLEEAIHRCVLIFAIAVQMHFPVWFKKCKSWKRKSGSRHLRAVDLCESFA